MKNLKEPAERMQKLMEDLTKAQHSYVTHSLILERQLKEIQRLREEINEQFEKDVKDHAQEEQNNNLKNL